MGLHQRQGPRIRGHPVRDRPGHTGRGQHHARGHPERGRRPRADPDDSIHGTYEQSEEVLRELATLGIDYNDVVRVLEDQGVGTFEASWYHLFQRLAAVLRRG